MRITSGFLAVYVASTCISLQRISDEKKRRRRSTQRSRTGITPRVSRRIELCLRFNSRFSRSHNYLGESTVNLRELAERFSETRRYLDGEGSIASRQSYDALYGEDTVRLRRAVGGGTG